MHDAITVSYTLPAQFLCFRFKGGSTTDQFNGKVALVALSDSDQGLAEILRAADACKVSALVLVEPATKVP